MLIIYNIKMTVLHILRAGGTSSIGVMWKNGLSRHESCAGNRFDEGVAPSSFFVLVLPTSDFVR